MSMEKPKLSKEARAFFIKCGQKGGHAGNHAAKGCGGSRERTLAMSELNRTRRTRALHPDNCWCPICTRYFSAKAKLKALREKKGKVQDVQVS